MRLEKVRGLKRLSVALEITWCKNLENMPNGFQSLRSLTELRIFGCPKLVNVLEKGWLPMLRELVVQNCEGIKTLPGDWNMMRMEGDNTDSLCVLEIMDGYLEVSISPFLSKRRITHLTCENVESLPEGIMRSCNLEKLSIRMFISYLISKRCVKHLFIYGWRNLKLLPDHMHNLTSLHIHGCKGLKFRRHHMQNLTSLQDLKKVHVERGLAFRPQLDTYRN